ncbi:sodium:proton antiporter [Lujinxingia litoralis]|uniref:Sodium:proton antiporter n=1 Tax=Lujinxingia litoralis TaxID=2211119 RepID=A0A328CBP4_9DELT|nr:DUF4040 domain-containing protein [Lujinxingia litoralis]RAL25294.1 sodium:proton antiporter [Lujinxingia litoralis]
MVVFDALVTVTLWALAVGAVSQADLFKSVVLFVTLGVVVAVAWARMGAADLAMVEVAVGAGVTGALFLNTLGHLEQSSEEGEGEK